MTKSSVGDNKQPLVYRETGQEYAKVLKMLGNNRCMLEINESKLEIMGIICGRMRKKQVHRISVDDIVLISLRDFQDDKADIIHVYSNEEQALLYNQGELTRILLHDEHEEDATLMFI